MGQEAKPKRTRRKSTKKRQPRSAKERAAEVAKRERIKEALDYRRQGYTYAEIAEQMQISTSCAYNYVQEGLAAIPRESAEEVKAMMLDRYDTLLSKLMPDFLADPEAKGFLLDQILKIEDRRMRVMGLGTPQGGTQVDVNMFGGGDTSISAKVLEADRPVLMISAGTRVPSNPVL